MAGQRDFVERATAIEADLAQLRGALFSGALQRIDEARAGLAASRFEAVTRSGPSDPTGSFALRSTDVAARHLTELGTALNATADALARALAVVALYPPPHVADADDRAALARINGREPCCENCAQLVLENGQRRWEPIDAAMAEASTVGDVLDEPMLLCQWCRKRTAAWGRLPNNDELARHHRGERVNWPDDVVRPA